MHSTRVMISQGCAGAGGSGVTCDISFAVEPGTQNGPNETGAYMSRMSIMALVSFAPVLVALSSGQVEARCPTLPCIVAGVLVEKAIGAAIDSAKTTPQAPALPATVTPATQAPRRPPAATTPILVSRCRERMVCRDVRGPCRTDRSGRLACLVRRHCRPVSRECRTAVIGWR